MTNNELLTELREIVNNWKQETESLENVGQTRFREDRSMHAKKEGAEEIEELIQKYD